MKLINLKKIIFVLKILERLSGVELKIGNIKVDNDRVHVSIAGAILPKEVADELGVTETKVYPPTPHKEPTMPKQPTTRELILKNTELIMQLFNRVDQIDKKVDAGFAEINARLDRMENTPTMKKELEESKKK